MLKNVSKRTKFIFTLISMILFIGLGCTVRSYKVVKERVDLEVTGNQGYLVGGPTEKKEPAKTTRDTYVVEVELGKPAKAEKEVSTDTSYTEESVIPQEEYKQSSQVAIITPQETKVPTVKTYVVKKGDTLEKIAARPEIYGDKKKWYKIFKANKDKIKQPDKIYPGQVLIIPE